MIRQWPPIRYVRQYQYTERLADVYASSHNGLKDMHKTLVFGLSLGIGCYISSPLKAPCEEFRNESMGFSLTIPSDMKRINIDNQSVGIALKTIKNQRYPTFNVVVSQPLDIELNAANLSRITEEVLNEYRGIGLTDVIAISAHAENIDSQPSITTSLRYSLAQDKLCSVVTIVPARSRRFILTYIDVCENRDALEAQSRTLRTGFRVHDPKSTKSLLSEGTAPKNKPLLVGLAVLVVVGAVIFILTRRRKPT